MRSKCDESFEAALQARLRQQAPVWRRACEQGAVGARAGGFGPSRDAGHLAWWCGGVGAVAAAAVLVVMIWILGGDAQPIPRAPGDFSDVAVLLEGPWAGWVSAPRDWGASLLSGAAAGLETPVQAELDRLTFEVRFLVGRVFESLPPLPEAATSEVGAI